MRAAEALATVGGTAGAGAGNETEDEIERENDRSRRTVWDAAVAIS